VSRAMHRFAPKWRLGWLVIGLAVLVAAGSGQWARGSDEKPKPETKATEGVPLELELPKPAFKGTPKHVPPGTRLEKPRGKPRPPFLAPAGSKCVSRGKPISSSDEEPIIGSLKLVTDGDKEADEGSYVELGPGRQYVQIDLKQPYQLDAVVLWHFHATPRVYHDVVVQVSDDADFVLNVRTLFNNDHDNSSGLGVGEALEYWDTYEGKLIGGRAGKARFVRCYSNGSIADDQNHYTELEVFGRPVK